MNLVKLIEGALGSRRRNLTEDQYQVFWVGVMKALKTADPKRDVVPYLILRGFGEVKNYKRSAFSYIHMKFCPVCGKIYTFRARKCLCGCELEIDNRHVEFLEHPYHQPDNVDRLSIEQFVDTLTGKSRFVARRWLIDRADLMYQNHIQQIAFELGISQAAVAKYKRKIKSSFQRWFHEV